MISANEVASFIAGRDFLRPVGSELVGKVTNLDTYVYLGIDSEAGAFQVSKRYGAYIQPPLCRSRGRARTMAKSPTQTRNNTTSRGTLPGYCLFSNHMAPTKATVPPQKMMYEELLAAFGACSLCRV